MSFHELCQLIRLSMLARRAWSPPPPPLLPLSLVAMKSVSPEYQYGGTGDLAKQPKTLKCSRQGQAVAVGVPSVPQTRS